MREEPRAGASAATDWRFAVLYESARALAEADTRADAIPRILKAICEALDWEHGALWDIDPDAGVLRCSCMWHVASVRFEAFEAISRAVSLPRGIGLPGRVWASASRCGCLACGVMRASLGRWWRGANRSAAHSECRS